MENVAYNYFMAFNSTLKCFLGLCWKRKRSNLVYLVSFIVFLTFIYFVTKKSFRGRHISVEVQDFSPFSLYYNEHTPDIIKYGGRKVTTVVLLYEAVMKRKTWESIGTPDLLQKQGYRVISIQLPTLFEAGAATPWPTHPLKGAILAETLKKLNAIESIIIASSFTGSFALPFVIRGGFNIKAFVAISPKDSDKFTRKEYSMLKTQTLIVYGNYDKTFGAEMLENMKHIPNKELVEIKYAGHFCHIDRPEEFHKVLLKFLKSLYNDAQS